MGRSKFVLPMLVGCLLGAGGYAIVEYRLTEWTTGNQLDPAFRYVEDRRDFPNALLIGDSISIGYTPVVQEALRQQFDVFRIPANAENSETLLRNVDRWLSHRKWDVIHFNVGLHDLRRDKTPDGQPWASPEQYERNLRAIVARLKQTGATLIFATTTPVPAEARGRNEGEERIYNEVAIKVMCEADIPINDLAHQPLVQFYQLPNNVHFGPEGSAVLGLYVAQAIQHHTRPETSAEVLIDKSVTPHTPAECRHR